MTILKLYSNLNKFFRLFPLPYRTYFDNIVAIDSLLEHIMVSIYIISVRSHVGVLLLIGGVITGEGIRAIKELSLFAVFGGKPSSTKSSCLFLWAIFFCPVLVFGHFLMFSQFTLLHICVFITAEEIQASRELI